MKKEQQNSEDKNQGKGGKKVKRIRKGKQEKGIQTGKYMTVEMKRERKASKSKKNTQEK